MINFFLIINRLKNKEFLQKALGKIKAHQNDQVSSPTMSTDSQLEGIQQELVKSRSRVADIEKRLRIFEGDISEIKTLCEAEYREHVLEETLTQVQMRKKVLETKYSSIGDQLPAPGTTSLNGFVSRTAPESIVDQWVPERDPQVQIMNFLDSNGLLPKRDQCAQGVEEILPPRPQVNLLHGQDMNVEDHISPRSGLDNETNLQQPLHFGQAIDNNLSAWTDLYSTEGNDSIIFQEGGERGLLELYLSQFAPSAILTPNQHQT